MTRKLKRKVIEAIVANLRAMDGDVDRLDEVAANRLGIHRADFHCLDIVSRGRAITPGQLATELGLTTGAITALLDRLEKARYLRRRRDRHDRRRILIEPSKRARAKVRPILTGVVTAANRALRLFRMSELRVILRFLNQNRAAIRALLPVDKKKPSARQHV